jgi:hypothetical protein
MIPMQTGPTLMSMAHAARRDDLARAAESRLRAQFAKAEESDGPHHRPWWWGLARARAT